MYVSSRFRFHTKLLTCLVLFGFVGAFDYLTGYEVSSYPIYLMPIFLTFFYFGRSAGFVACVVATTMWAVIDRLDHHPYIHEFPRYWNPASRLFIYALFVYGLSIYTQTIAAHRRRLELLGQIIPICHGCGRIFSRDGTWKTPEAALELSGALIPECPECAKDESKTAP